MRNLEKVVLLLTVTVAALAIAPAALGQSPVTVSRELDEGDSGCGVVEVFDDDIVEGVCSYHATSVADFSIEVFDIQVSECESEAWIALDRGGAGQLYEQALTGGSCTLDPCEEEDEALPWPIQVEETTGSAMHALLEICLEGQFGDVECDFEADLTTTGHSYLTLAADEAVCSNAASIEVSGEWETDAATEESQEIVFTAPTNPMFRPMVWSYNFAGATPGTPGAVYEVEFKNETGAPLTTEVPEKRAAGRHRFALYDPGDGQRCREVTIPNNGHCWLRVIKAFTTPPGAAGFYIPYTQGGNTKESETFSAFG